MEDQNYTQGAKMATSTETSGPQGDLLLRTMPMPADTSFNGDIFGGWIMSQMDIAGSIMAKEITRTRTATVAVESMKFIKPVRVGDVVCCYGRVMKIGTTSVTIMLEVWVRPVLRATEDRFTTFKVTEAAFTYVAINEDGKKQAISKERLPL
jgi:acyl-CoA thioesterase YciA